MNKVVGAVLDGRACYFYLLWIEPALTELSAKPARLRHGQEARDFTSFAEVKIDGHPLCVHSESSGVLERHVPLVRAAVESIREVGLGYIVEFGLERVVVTGHGQPADFGVCALRGAQSRTTLAVEMLESASRAFWSDWLRAAVDLGGASGDETSQSEIDRTWAEEQFVASIKLQYLDRINADGADRIRTRLEREAPAAFERIIRAHGTSIVSELFCLMYGGWDRMQFNNGSPTKYWSQVRKFTAAEATQFLAIGGGRRP